MRRVRDLGFPLEILRATLALSNQPDRPCGGVGALVIGQLHEIERKIADLQRLRDELDRIAHQCRVGSRVADCRIIDALSPWRATQAVPPAKEAARTEAQNDDGPHEAGRKS